MLNLRNLLGTQFDCRCNSSSILCLLNQHTSEKKAILETTQKPFGEVINRRQNFTLDLKQTNLSNTIKARQ